MRSGIHFQGYTPKLSAYVLTTTCGIFGLLIAIFFVFFQIKSPIKISKKDTIFIIIWLFLTILGSVDIYYTNRTHNEIVASQNDNDDENDSDDTINDQESEAENEQGDEAKTNPENLNDDDNDEENSNLSEEELLILKNKDLIQELKKSNRKTAIFGSNSIKLYFSETAGYIYSDIKKNGKFEILDGEMVIPSKVIIIDYFSDDIIYTFNNIEKNYIEYFPNNEDKFYCIIYHEQYSLYVTQPIKVVGGNNDSIGTIKISLTKENDTYTPLFQLYAYMKNPRLDEYYSTCSSDYSVSIQCKNIYSGEGYVWYLTDILDSGMISYSNCSYISLNYNYIMDLSLYKNHDIDSILSQTTIDKLETDSNVMKIYFDIISEPDTNG